MSLPKHTSLRFPHAFLFYVHFIHQVAFARRHEGTFRSLSQAAPCPPVYHTRQRLHTVPLIAEG